MKYINSFLDLCFVGKCQSKGTKNYVYFRCGVYRNYYNLIYRKNINHYFLAKTLKDTKIHHESFGDSFIKDILWLSLDEAIELFRNMGDTGLPKIVKERELPVLLKAKELLGGK